MKKQIATLVGVFVLTSAIPLHAEGALSLEDESGNPYANGSTVCANLPLHFRGSDTSYEVLILDQDTHLVYDVFNVTPNMPDIVLPINAGDVELMVNTYDENGAINIENPEKIELTVANCGTQTSLEYDYYTGVYNEVELEEVPTYDKIDFDAEIVYNDEALNVYYTLEDNQKLEYQFVTDSGKTNAKKLRFNDEGYARIKKIKSSTIQFKLTTTDENDKDTSKYYEVELYPSISDYSIREVKEFGLEKIEGMSVIDFRTVLWTILLIMFYGVVNLAYKKQKRRYRKHKIHEARMKEKNDIKK